MEERRFPVRVAIVGLGYFSRFHREAWLGLDDAEIVAVADRDADRAGAAGRELGVPAFPDPAALVAAVDPDLVDIVTPPPTHADFIRRALRPGRVIVCQKPFCRDLAEATAVTTEAEAAGAILIVHENFRFQPWHREVKRRLDEGMLGRVYQARFVLRPGDGRGPDAYLARQPSFQGMERFLVHETGVHFLDTFSWLFGPVRSVYADLRQLNPAIAGEDAGIVILHHEGGTVSVFDGNRLGDHVAENRRKTMGDMVVEGEAGALRLDGEGRLFFRPFASNDEMPVPFEYEDRDFAGGSVSALCRHVIRHLQGQGELENTAREYLRIVALDEVAYRSAARGARIDLTGSGA